jgi:hypothetical protein
MGAGHPALDNTITAWFAVVVAPTGKHRTATDYKDGDSGNNSEMKPGTHGFMASKSQGRTSGRKRLRGVKQVHLPKPSRSTELPRLRSHAGSARVENQASLGE